VNPRWLARFHLAMMAVWVGLAIPGLIFWKESVTFVIILSLYANFAGEAAAWQASRAEVKEDQNG
jgi:hypothetical protein